MCTHRFIFPEDKQENYNRDGRTLTGRCRCGAVQKANGLRWMIRREDNFHEQDPKGCGSLFSFVDKSIKMW